LAGIIFLIRDLLDQSSVSPVIEIALLRSGRFCTLNQLRMVELEIFGSIAAYLAVQDYRLVFQEVI
jgi:hypothetical protein